MKVRVTFNDGKNFSHYAFVVFKAGLIITYVCSGLLMFGTRHVDHLENDLIKEAVA